MTTIKMNDNDDGAIKKMNDNDVDNYKTNDDNDDAIKKRKEKNYQKKTMMRTMIWEENMTGKRPRWRWLEIKICNDDDD